MPAALPLQTTHWVIPTAVNVSALSESPTNPSTTCVTQPKGHGSMQISTARVCFYLCLFLLLCNVWANRVCPLSPSGSHRFKDLSMLAWSTHCDVNALGSKDYHVLPSWLPSMASESCCMQWSSVKVDARSGLGHQAVQTLLGLNGFPLRFDAAVRPLWQQG